MRRIAIALLLAASSLRADVRLRSVPPRVMEPSHIATWRFLLINDAATEERALPVTFSFGDEDVLSVPAACEAPRPPRDVVRCVVDLAPSAASAELAFTIRFRAIKPAFGRAATTVSIGPNFYREEAVFAHDFFVTNVADSGPGSLRDAIEQVNQRCADDGVASHQEPCRISFAMSASLPAEGWYTIAPNSPLPVLTAYDVVIDGTTQTNDFGPPRIMLDGRELREGHGLEFRSRNAEVVALAIGFFPQNGIFAIPSPSQTATGLTIKRTYLGVDPTGVTPAPNGWRGLQTYHSYGTVSDNVIGGNRRAGAFFARASQMMIEQNLIGVGVDRKTPLGNGAAGVFIDVPLPETYAQIPVPVRLQVRDNVVAFNAQAGLAVTNGSELDIGKNRFFNNAGEAIDFGLNGRGGTVQPPPFLRAAHYADGVTTIEGAASLPSAVYLYASGQLKANGTVEAEEFIGQVAAKPSFTLTVPGDLRGLYITASSSAYTFGQIPNGCICDVPEQHLLSTELSAPRLVD